MSSATFWPSPMNSNSNYQPTSNIFSCPLSCNMASNTYPACHNHFGSPTMPCTHFHSPMVLNNGFPNPFGNPTHCPCGQAHFQQFQQSACQTMHSNESFRQFSGPILPPQCANVTNCSRSGSGKWIIVNHNSMFKQFLNS